MKKKTLALLPIVILTVIVLAMATSVTPTANAAEPHYVSFFVYNEDSPEKWDIAWNTAVYNGDKLTEFYGYDDLSYKYDMLGKKLVYKEYDTEQVLTAPLSVETDMSIKIYFEDTDEEVTYTYKYGLDKSESFSYKYGERVLPPDTLDGATLVENAYFSSDHMTRATNVKFYKYAQCDVTYYPVLNKAVNFKFNDVDYICPYGSDINDVVGSDTHAVLKLYADKKRTTRYNRSILNPVSLYGDIERTHYKLTFVYDNSTRVEYLPVDENVLNLNDMPYIEEGYEWRIDETKKLEYPLIVSEDTEFHVSNGLNNPITNGDRVLLYIALAALIAMSVGGALLEHKKSKKKLQAEKAATQSITKDAPEEEQRITKDTPEETGMGETEEDPADTEE